MLVRDSKRLGLLIGPLFVLLITSFSLWEYDIKIQLQSHLGAAFHGQTSPINHDQARVQTATRDPTPAPTHPTPALSHHPPPPHLDPPPPPPLQTPQAGTNRNNNAKPAALSLITHHELFSIAGHYSLAYFPILFSNTSAFSPNILPHPARDPSAHFFEVACTTAFAVVDGARVLQCLEPPADLPIAAPAPPPTAQGLYEGELALPALSVGSHDAHVFHGPEGGPYVMFGARSWVTCFGPWMRDFTGLQAGV